MNGLQSTFRVARYPGIESNYTWLIVRRSDPIDVRPCAYYLRIRPFGRELSPNYSGSDIAICGVEDTIKCVQVDRHRAIVHVVSELYANVRVGLCPFLFRRLFRTIHCVLIITKRRPITSFRGNGFTPRLNVRQDGFRSSVSSTRSGRILERRIRIRGDDTNVCFLALLGPICYQGGQYKAHVSRSFFPLRFSVPFQRHRLSSVDQGREAFSHMSHCVKAFTWPFVVVISWREHRSIFPTSDLFMWIHLFQVVVIVRRNNGTNFIRRHFHQSANSIKAHSSVRRT